MEFSILIVDDEESICLNLAELLRIHFGKSCTTFLAQSAEEALEVFKQKKPDIVVTDVLLPKMSGIDLTKQLRQLNYRSPIIVFSGGGRGEDIVKQVLLDAAKEVGAISTISKPFKMESLVALIESALKSLE